MRVAFRPPLAFALWGRQPAADTSGAVLLEVVLALVLFVSAAAVLSSGLSSSLTSLERLRLNTHALDLAVSVMSELQLGTKTVALTGPQPCGVSWEGWTWEAVATPMQADGDEASPFRRVEVIIRHDDPAVVYRLCEMIRLTPASAGGTEGLPGVGSF